MSPPSFTETRQRRQKARVAGADPDYWYPVERESAVERGRVVEVKFGGRSIALFRGDDGRLRALENRCAHRHLPLTLGTVDGCRLTCMYHGWSYDESGRLAAVPHDLFGHAMPSVAVGAYPVQVRYGLVWIFPGDPARAAERRIPDIPELEGPDRWAFVTLDFRWRAHYSFIVDNVSDFTHAWLHRKYRPFDDAQLTRCEAVEDRVYVSYRTHVGRSKIAGLFIDHGRINTDAMDLCYQYPYQWSNTGGKIKSWCLLLPMDERSTRVFFLFYFESLRVPFTPVRLPRPVMALVLRIASRLHIARVLRQDGQAVEAEQLGYEAHHALPIPDLNPAVGLFQQLIVRKWEEHLERAGRA